MDKGKRGAPAPYGEGGRNVMGTELTGEMFWGELSEGNVWGFSRGEMSESRCRVTILYVDLCHCHPG